MLWARIENQQRPAEKFHRQDGIAQWPIQGQINLAKLDFIDHARIQYVALDAQ